mmetsp:Transcript_148001/g.368874  ORF Transcript_148001/g.368874 Transcript_148001/m.368874 type:complete len:744 (+) Transcript_148001:181-2412(+)
MANLQADSKLPRGMVLPALPEQLFHRQQEEFRSALQEEQQELMSFVEGWAKRLEHSALERRQRHEVQIIQFFAQQPPRQPLPQLFGAPEPGTGEEVVGLPQDLFLADVGQASHPHSICEAPPDVPRRAQVNSGANAPPPRHFEREGFLKELHGAQEDGQSRPPAGGLEMNGVIPSPPERLPAPLRSDSPETQPQEASAKSNGKKGVGVDSADESNSDSGMMKDNNTSTKTIAASTPKASPSLIAKRGRTSITLALNSDNHEYAPRTIGWFVHSKQFMTVTSILILANAVCIGAQAQYLLDMVVDSPGVTDSGAWEWVSRCFTVYFAFELLLRVLDEKLEFLFGEQKQWNIFDSLLVVFSLVDWVMQSSNLPNLSFMRVLRVVRSIRILRLVRVLRTFHSFRVLVSSLIHSVLSLVWVVLLLLLACYTFAVLMLYGVVEYIADPANSDVLDPGNRDLLMIDTMKEHYGSVPKGLLTLFMGISGGKDWGDLMNPLLAIHWSYALVWCFYIFAVVFGMLNVVTGVFVARAHELSLNDREIMVQQELALERSYAKHIVGFFHEADKDGSGELSWEELEGYLQDETVKAYFATLQLDVGQAKALFRLLDTDESNAVGIDEFVEGCMRLRGAAKNIDVNMLLLESEKLMHTFRAFMDGIELRLKHIEEHVGYANSDRGLLAKGLISQEHEKLLADLSTTSRPSSRGSPKDPRSQSAAAERRSVLGRGLAVIQSLTGDVASDTEVERIRD